jgi:hypothetical protein
VPTANNAIVAATEGNVTFDNNAMHTNRPISGIVGPPGSLIEFVAPMAVHRTRGIDAMQVT